MTYQDAYRFSATIGDVVREGTVFRYLPRRITWEARIDGTDIAVRGETRAEAVAAALDLARST